MMLRNADIAAAAESGRKRTPAFMLAAEGSGRGKTTLTLTVLAALRERGLRVQSFKCGPDLIDPLLAAEMTGRPSYNLDTFLAGDAGIRGIYSHYAGRSELSVVEGVMGLFDGRVGARRPDGLPAASAASAAAVLELPVFLIVDMQGRAQSALPLIRGFAGEHPRVMIAGVILNRISPMLAARLIPELEEGSGLHVVGALPELSELERGSRQLGLISPFEQALTEEDKAVYARLGREYLKLDRMLELAALFAKNAEPFHEDFFADYPENLAKGCRLGLALDKAFYFYDPLSLDLLKHLGVELVPFSPLDDERLPEDLDGLYLGGGYPERFAERLSQNEAMHASLKKAVLGEKRPCLAEGGGRILLGRSLTLLNGESYPMAGLFDERFEMTERLQNFGYADFQARGKSLIFRRGEHFPGNEFHYARCREEGAEEGAAFSVCREAGRERFGGVADAHGYRGFLQLRAASMGRPLQRFAEALKQEREKRTEKRPEERG